MRLERTTGARRAQGHFVGGHILRNARQGSAFLALAWFLAGALCGSCFAIEPVSGAFSYDGRINLTVDVGAPAGQAPNDFAAAELERYFSRILNRELNWKIVERQWPDDAWRIRLRATGSWPSDPLVATNRPFAPGQDEFEVSAATNALTLSAASGASLLYAVYQVLEQQGCRWLYPGADGEIVPTKTNLVCSQQVRTRADFSMRGLFPVENLQRYTETDVIGMLDWMGKNRMNYLEVIGNYGWDRLGKTLLAESRKRGIHVVGYLWSFEVFLPLAVGRTHPEYFAFFDGKRQVDYNVKRCASSEAAIKIFVENGTRWFQEHPELEEWLIIPNDGFHWCECDKCRDLKPQDQWAAFFVPLMQKLAVTRPRVRLQNFIYVMRYALPRDIAPFQTPRLDHFFDVHLRNNWFSLRDPAAPVESGHREAEVDDRARGQPLNHYLADRLGEWRAAVPGRIWIFENVMLHGTYSLPVPNLPQVAADLQAAHRENIQGYLFEAYLQGWNSFAPELWSLARLCWNTETSPAALEQEYFRELLGEQAGKMTGFYASFRATELKRVRQSGSLFWLYSAPEALRRYTASVRAIDASRLHSPGRLWLDRQLQVAALMEQLARAGGRTSRSVLGDSPPAAVLNACEQALQTGPAMDGVFFAYEQLRQLFLREFPRDALGFCPVLPDTFSPEVRALFGRQKLWDTLAEWESAGRFPRDASDPDRWLREILQQAIADRRVYAGR